MWNRKRLEETSWRVVGGLILSANGAGCYVLNRRRPLSPTSQPPHVPQTIVVLAREGSGLELRRSTFSDAGMLPQLEGTRKTAAWRNEIMEWSSYRTEVPNKFSVEIREPQERLCIFTGGWSRPVDNSLNFLLIHLNLAFRNDKSLK